MVRVSTAIGLALSAVAIVLLLTSLDPLLKIAVGAAAVAFNVVNLRSAK